MLEKKIILGTGASGLKGLFAPEDGREKEKGSCAREHREVFSEEKKGNEQ